MKVAEDVCLSKSKWQIYRSDCMHVCCGATNGDCEDWGLSMQCLAYWEKVKGAERWGPEWSLRALAAAQRVQLSLSAFADNIYNLVQPHADSFK